MLSELADRIADFIDSIIATLGVPGISMIALLENLFPPTPSEVLYPLAGKLAAEGKITLWGIVIGGISGSLIGALCYYAVGYHLGEQRTRTLIERYGTFRLRSFKLEVFRIRDYDRSLELFRKYGAVIVFVARLMPLVHGVVSFPAGVVRMNIALFLAFTAVGSALWIAPLAIFGWWLGSHWALVLEWLNVYYNFVFALIALFVCYYIYRRLRHRPGI